MGLSVMNDRRRTIILAAVGFGIAVAVALSVFSTHWGELAPRRPAAEFAMVVCAISAVVAAVAFVIAVVRTRQRR